MSRFSKFLPKTRVATLTALSLAAMALAAAEPSLSSHESADTRTLNAVIVLDVSRSMLAEDGPEGITRLETGIRSIKRLLDTYPDGRFGLVLYTNQVVEYAPTFDHEALRVILDNIRDNYANAVRGEGSDAVMALDAAAEMTKQLPYTVNTVFLISDGGKSLATIVLSTGSPTTTAAAALKKLTSLRLHLVTAGVGELIPTAIPVYEDGELVGYHQYQNTIVYTALDEAPLQFFAEETAGFYLHLVDPDDLVRVAQSKNLDSQPIAQDSSANLAWLAAAVSIFLVLLRINPRS